MASRIQTDSRKSVRAVVGKAKARCSSSAMRPEYLAEIESFRLMDDDFMSKCLENAPECIELILQVILGKKDLKVVKSQTEYPIKSLQGRGVRFDVFARDSKRRARYNSALMDANALKSGDGVDKLRDTYVIFITEADVLGGGKEVYQVARTIRELECKDFGDGAHIIYVNGATRSASDIGKLVHDLQCSDAAKMYFDVLRRRVSQFKNSEEGRRVMCKTMERIKAEGKSEGIAEGKRETMLATAKRMLKSGMLALNDIAKFSGLSLAEVKKLRSSMA